MTQQDLLYWYEASLSTHERKMRGHFSTPPRLVEQMLDACGYTADKDLKGIRVLDPACGSGNLLSAAAARLINSGLRAGLSSRKIAQQVQKNIWGFDPDPVACFLAETQLHTTINTIHPTSKRHHRLHIHQADGLAFPWSSHAPIDLFLANPPYLASKNNDLSGYRTTHQRGQADSYLLFLDLALQIVRPGGWIGLVLPDSVLARSHARREREKLLKESTIHHLWHLADVFTAFVGAVVIIAQKTPPSSSHAIQWRRERWEAKKARKPRRTQEPPANIDTGQQRVTQKLLLQQPHMELRYLLHQSQYTLIERIQRESIAQSSQIERTLIYLQELVSIRRGEELGKDSYLLQAHPPPIINDEWYPILRGGSDIRPYMMPTGRRWIHRQHIAKPLTRYQRPKLLIVKSMGRLQAALDLNGHIVLQTLYMLHYTPCNGESNAPHFSEEEELYFLLALLNSRLLQEYIYILHTAYKWVQPQIEQHVLTHLPVPLCVDYQQKRLIIQRARLLMHACSTVSSDVELKEQHQILYETQEQAIYTLYRTALGIESQ